MIVELDGNGIHNEGEFHRQMAEKLEFPAYYGNNLNALWDVLTTEIPRPLSLIWKDADASREMMGESFDAVLSVLRKVEKFDRDLGLVRRFTIELR